MHTVSHIDYVAQHTVFRRFGGFAADEFHIQFQNVQPQAAQHTQGRIAASKIVHFYHEPHFPQILYGGNNLILIFRIGALRKFQVQIRRVYFVLFHQIQEKFL